MEVSCYSCGVLGHVALQCKSTIINSDKDVVKSRWLQNRMGNRKVNPNITEPNFKRPERKKVARHCLRRESANTERTRQFPEELQSKIEHFVTEEKQASQYRRNSVSETRTALPRVVRPNYENIFESFSSGHDSSVFPDDSLHPNSIWSALLLTVTYGVGTGFGRCTG